MSAHGFRHLSREIALQILYRKDMPTLSLDAKSILDDLNDHFEHFHVADEAREFSALLVTGVVFNRPELDLAIESAGSSWRLERMSPVDRNLLRIATYELLRQPQLPERVIFDEAIELAKRFGEAQSPGFINGVLDSIWKARESGKIKPLAMT